MLQKKARPNGSKKKGTLAALRRKKEATRLFRKRERGRNPVEKAVFNEKLGHLYVRGRGKKLNHLSDNPP